VGGLVGLGCIRLDLGELGWYPWRLYVQYLLYYSDCSLTILSLAQSSLHYNKPPSISVFSLFFLLLYQRRLLVNSLPRCASSLHTVSRLTPHTCS
jgi:hypothetical protein